MPLPRKHILSLVLIFTLMCSHGCAKFLLGDKSLNHNPLERPQVNITNFSEALECMDQLMIDYDTPLLRITAQDLANKTGDGQPLAGTKEMLITSISKISEKSGRIKFISYGTDQRDIILLHNAHARKDEFITPDYFIRGGITQMDRNVFAARFGGALNDDDWNVAFTSGQGISYAAMDMSVGEINTLQILSGIHSSNVLAIYDRGAGTDLGGRLNSVGSFFDFGIDRRDGVGQAIRNMIDLGVIEVIGKLTQTPYMTCLPLDSNHPEVLKLISKAYQKEIRSPDRLIKSLQIRLKKLNYYQGPINGKLSSATLNAIEYFRYLYNMPQKTPAKTIDFRLYKAVLYDEVYPWDFKSTYALSEQTPSQSTPFSKHPSASGKVIEATHHYLRQPKPLKKSKKQQAPSAFSKPEQPIQLITPTQPINTTNTAHTNHQHSLSKNLQRYQQPKNNKKIPKKAPINVRHIIRPPSTKPSAPKWWPTNR